MRRKRLLIQGELVVMLFRPYSHHHYRVVHGIPSDARVVGSSFDRLTATLTLVLESELFEPIEAGQELPAIVLEAENLRHRAFPITIGN